MKFILIIVLCEDCISDLLAPDVAWQGLPPVHAADDVLHPGLGGPEAGPGPVPPDGRLVVAVAA